MYDVDDVKGMLKTRVKDLVGISALEGRVGELTSQRNAWIAFGILEFAVALLYGGKMGAREARAREGEKTAWELEKAAREEGNAVRESLQAAEKRFADERMTSSEHAAKVQTLQKSLTQKQSELEYARAEMDGLQQQELQNKLQDMMTAKPLKGGGSEPGEVELLRGQLKEIEDRNHSLVNQLTKKQKEYNRIVGELSHVKNEIAWLQRHGFTGRNKRGGRRGRAARAD
eukprot:2608820-Rhodomonas_salina.1